jgi:hypothetical protein
MGLDSTKVFLCAAAICFLATELKVISAAHAQSQRQELRQISEKNSVSSTYSTRENQTVEIILRDGTAIVLAPNSVVDVRFDAESGKLSIDLRTGSLRVSGGVANIKQPITITTAHSVMSLVNGAAFASVASGATRVHLLNGTELQIRSGSASRVLYRPGFQLTAGPDGLSSPRRMTAEQVTADLHSLSPGLETGIAPVNRSSAQPQRESVSQTASLQQSGGGDTVLVASAGNFGAPVSAGEDLAELSAPEQFEPSGSDQNSGGAPTTPGGPDNPIQTFDFGGLPSDLNLAGTFGTSELGNSTVRAENTSTASEGRAFYKWQEGRDDTVRVSIGGFTRGGDIGTYQSRGLLFATDADGNVIPVTSIVPDDSRPVTVDESNFDPQDPNLSGLRLFLSERSFGPTTNSTFGGSRLSYSLSDTSAPSFFSTRPSGAAIEDETGLSYFSGDGVIGLRAAGVYENGDITGRIFFDRNSGDPDFSRGVVDELFAANSIVRRGVITDIVFNRSYDSIANILNYGVFSEERSNNEREADNYVFFDIQSADILVITRQFDDSGQGTSFLTYEVNGENFLIDCTAIVCSDEIRSHIQSIYGLESSELPVYRPSSSSSLSVVALPTGVVSPIVPGENEQIRTIFAAGDLDDAINAPASRPGTTDRFILSAGIEGRLLDELRGGGTVQDLAGFDGMDDLQDVRAFARLETWTDLGDDLSSDDITSSPVYVFNPPQENEGVQEERSALLHADFALRFDGDRQISTISATIGEVEFREHDEPTDPDGSPNTSVDAIITARTVGSSNGPGLGDSSALFGSRYLSTSAGGGNPNIGETGGRLGFFTLENSGAVFDDIASSDGSFAPNQNILNGGYELPLGTSGSSGEAPRFGTLRLAVGTGTESFESSSRSDFSAYQGFAAALVEREVNSGQNIQLSVLTRANSELGTLTFDGFSEDHNRFSATLNTGSGASSPIVFGGTSGFSAVGNMGEFGATTRGFDDFPLGTDMALISGDLVSEQLESDSKFRRSDHVESYSTSSPRDYDHVKWGFFFGDTSTTEGSREHVHLGSFAAGRPFTEDQLNVRDETITYSGHAIGNVVNGSSVYTSVGSYTDEFNFADREGMATLVFDGNTYTGDSVSNLVGDSILGYSVDSFQPDSSLAQASSDRFGTAQGIFVGEAVSGTPDGVVGQFELSNGAGGDSLYRATGTFAAESP